MMNTMVALELRNVSKVYKTGVVALKGIDLDVKQGDFFALLGPNGAGKSTTIGIVSTLTQPTTGTVKIFGHDIKKESSLAKLHLGLVPQEFNFNIFETVLDIVLNQAGFYGIPTVTARESAEYYLHKLGLWEKRFEIGRNLSGGMKRRLMIARGLVHHPKLLILDEPTAGVDIELRRQMWDFLKEMNKSGVTIILTTHYLEEAELLCRNIAIIDKGSLIANTSVKNLLSQTKEETLVIDLEDELASLPEIPGFQLHQVDGTCIEVTYKQGTRLNDLFENLNKRGVHMTSMRHKTNRLEELFLQLINQQEQ
jgi:ABC-2 type transport system ATP-binding protein